MPQIDPELLSLLQRSAYYRSHREEAELSPAAVPDPRMVLNIAVQFKGAIAELKALGFQPGSVVGQVSFGSITLENLEKLAAHPHVLSIEKQRREHVSLNQSIPDIQANQVWSFSGGSGFSGFTGKDVIVGIVDTGIDFHHQNFRKSDGTSRILRIWDQTLTAEGTETAPAAITDAPIISVAGEAVPLGYGVEYTQTDINGTLQNAGLPVTARHQDEHGHGTHVAGIAAGNGNQAGGCLGDHKYIGVAPEADIIMVRKWGLTPGDSNGPSTSTGTMIDAIYYILNLAKNTFHKPVVINLSLGIFTEKMDGSSAICQTLDHLLTNTAHDEGFAIVFSAGNDADANFHAQATVPAGAGSTLELPFSVWPGDKKKRYVRIVYSGSNLQVRITSPVSGSDGVVGWVAPGANATSTTANGTATGASVNIWNDPNSITVAVEPFTGNDNTAQNENRSGGWKIELQATDGNSTPMDAFCLYGSSHDSESIYFTDHTTVMTTLDEYATAKEVIAVGAYQVSSAEEHLADFSARGLTLDLRLKPEITAPGVGIQSAIIESAIPNRNCCCDCCHDFYTQKSGTSMAAPHVAGAVALLLQKDPNLTHTEILDALTSHTRAKPAGSTLEEDMGWGTGKLNIKAAIDGVTAAGGGGSGPHAPHYKPVPKEKTAEAELFERFQRSKRGQEFIDLFHHYFQEIRDLINTNKKVATVWHRSKGPLWVRAAMRAASSPALPIPVEIEGFCLKEGVARMLAILRRFGSDMLIRDLDKYEEDLLLIKEGMNVYQLMHALTDPVPA